MADDSKNVDKLKELEVNIARELDQKVRLSEPTDPRLDGTVQLNPDLSNPPHPLQHGDFQKTPSQSGATQEQNVIKPDNAGTLTVDKKVDDITLDEVDSMLSEVDEGFGGVLKEIKSEVGQLQFQQGMESISIGSDYLKEAGNEDDVVEKEEEIKLESTEQINISEEYFDETKDAEAPPEISKNFWSYLFSISFSFLYLPIEFLLGSLQQLKQLKSLPPRQVIIDTLGVFKSVVQIRLQLIKEFIDYLKEFSVKSYLKAALLIILMTALTYVLKDLKNKNQKIQERDPFLKSFEDVADEKNELAANENESSDSKIPEYVISMPRMVGNLKSPTPRRQSMVAAELYLQTSEREAAIEIKNRQKEVLDIAARTFEQFSYKDLDSIEGKDRLKLRLKLAINKILNNGRVQAVFFKSFQMSE